MGLLEAFGGTGNVAAGVGGLFASVRAAELKQEALLRDLEWLEARSRADVDRQWAMDQLRIAPIAPPVRVVAPKVRKAPTIIAILGMVRAS